MDQPRVENNNSPREDPIVNATPANRSEENQNLPGSNVNNNQNPEPLHIVLQEIVNAFREATVEPGYISHECMSKRAVGRNMPSVDRNLNQNLQPNPNQVQKNESDVQPARTMIPAIIMKKMPMCSHFFGTNHIRPKGPAGLRRYQKTTVDAPVVAPVVNPGQPVIEVTPACPRRKRGPSVIDQLEPYNIAQDILNTQARPPVEPMEDSESKDTFDEFEYEDEILKEAEGYFAEEAPDPAVYLANMEELLACETDAKEETLDQKLEKNLAEAPLEPEEREAALNLLNKEKNIFARNMNNLGKMTVAGVLALPMP
ncbi:31836_t:CDS:2 [Gigaspora margarita]|uniref:31836_t:CDS:1 n=1 Tax=Gigaspora margarita TaxID=4874 RepID=A0ABN7VGJ2_GIGMA|nr:31836_t:CDS:2 [Gigaspora margarita]